MFIFCADPFSLLFIGYNSYPVLTGYTIPSGNNRSDTVRLEVHLD